ncbi:DUF1848 domain-containing protein [Spartinivicinus ruber]|uniref:DUF1848 domain-containing protein n=1 Tax=Spartinivicinus ruber TaxID=2683272 RepID=UPI0013D40BC2|nr:DUF1848 domain-containing protein [Spartinivicinus ruber]
MQSTTIKIIAPSSQASKPNYVSQSIVYIYKGRIVKILNNIEPGKVNSSNCFSFFKHCLKKQQSESQSHTTPFYIRNETGQWLRTSLLELLQLFQKKTTAVATLNTSDSLNNHKFKNYTIQYNTNNQIKQLTDQLSGCTEETLTDAEIISFYQLVKKLAKELPEGTEFQELTELLATQAKLQNLAIARELLKQQLYQQLSQFEQPGSSSEYQAQLRLSVGACLLGLDLLEGGVTFKAVFKVLTDDDTGILEIRAAGLKLSLAAGDKAIAEGVVGAQADCGTVYSDESLMAFVDRYVDSIMGALFTAATSKSIGQLMDWKRNQTYVELQQQALSSQYRLNNLLLKQGLPAQWVPELSQEKKIPMKMKLLTGKVAAGVQLFKRIFSSELSASRLKADIAKREPLVDSLKQDVLRLFRFDQHYYSKSIRDLSKLGCQQQVPFVDRAKQVLDKLVAEYQHYTELVQFCDYARANPKKIQPSHLAQAKKVKASIEAQRGTKGRVDYLKSVSISYVALLQLYLASCPAVQRQQYEQAYQAFEKQLRQPLFYVPLNKMIKQLSFPTRCQLLRNEYGGTLSLALPSENAGLSLNVTYTDTEQHPNYYRQGKFLDFTIKLDNQFNVENILSLIASDKTAFTSLDSILQSSRADSENNPATPGVTQQSILSQLRQTLSHVFDVGLELGASLECRFKQSVKGHWSLQFVRIKTQMGRAAMVPGLGVLVAPAVKAAVSAKAAEKQTVVRQEWLGSNTLSYLLPIYNTLHNTEQIERWQLFMQQHEKELKKMFIAIATPGTSIREETEKLLAKINNSDLELALFAKINDFKQHATANNYQEVLPIFNEFLESQKEVHLKLSEKVWHD